MPSFKEIEKVAKNLSRSPGFLLVNYGGFQTTKQERFLLTAGLYSCIALILWNKKNKVASMAHIPIDRTFSEWKPQAKNFTPFSQTTEEMIDKMIASLQTPKNTTYHDRKPQAFLIGGRTSLSEELAERITQKLRAEGVRIVYEDIFGPTAPEDQRESLYRNIVFNTQTGKIGNLETFLIPPSIHEDQTLP